MISLPETYHPQLVELKQSLVHAGLVDLELLFFLTKASLEVPIPLSILCVDIVKRSSLVLL